MAAALLLLLLGGPEGEAGGLARLGDPSHAVRERAVERLAHGPIGTEILVGHLDHADAHVALGVARALERRADPGALPALARAADGPDPVRAAAAADAAVAIAFRRLVPLEDLHFEGMTRLPSRLEVAAWAAVEATLGGFRRRPEAGRGRPYAPLLAGGRYTAGALRRILADPTAATAMREHALHAYARLRGAAAHDAIAAALHDPEPKLRAAAATLAERHAVAPALATLAGRLDSDRLLTSTEAHVGVRALRRNGGTPGPRATERLEAHLRGFDFDLAIEAALVLRRGDRARADAAVRTCLDKLLEVPNLGAGSVMAMILFEIRLGPLPPDLHERMRASGHGLLLALLAPDWPAARDAIGPMLAPAVPLGQRETPRARSVYALLQRHRAPWADRARFAAPLMRSDSSWLRRLALWTLRGAPADVWAPLRPHVRRALDDRYEATRLAAAALLVPDAAAVRVCAEALYLGDPGSARSAAAILGERWPVDGAAPVAQRRRRALAILAALEQGGGR